MNDWFGRILLAAAGVALVATSIVIELRGPSLFVGVAGPTLLLPGVGLVVLSAFYGSAAGWIGPGLLIRFGHDARDVPPDAPPRELIEDIPDGGEVRASRGPGGDHDA